MLGSADELPVENDFSNLMDSPEVENDTWVAAASSRKYFAKSCRDFRSKGFDIRIFHPSAPIAFTHIYTCGCFLSAQGMRLQAPAECRGGS